MSCSLPEDAGSTLKVHAMERRSGSSPVQGTQAEARVRRVSRNRETATSSQGVLRVTMEGAEKTEAVVSTQVPTSTGATSLPLRPILAEKH